MSEADDDQESQETREGTAFEGPEAEESDDEEERMVRWRYDGPPAPLAGAGVMEQLSANQSQHQPMHLQNCDWEAHPAERILSETASGKFLVMRRGLDFTHYGLVRATATAPFLHRASRCTLPHHSLQSPDSAAPPQVDAAAVKAQRMGVAPGAPPCPVSLAMLDEYESFKKLFKQEVHANLGERGGCSGHRQRCAAPAGLRMACAIANENHRAEGGELVLDDLAPGSSLERWANAHGAC